jgi:hypothetical protein
MTSQKVYSVIDGENYPFIKIEFLLNGESVLTTENDIYTLWAEIESIPLDEYLELINQKIDESINYFNNAVKCRLKFSEVSGRIELLLTRKQSVLEYQESLQESGEENVNNS